MNMQLDKFISESLNAVFVALKTAREKSGVPISRPEFRSDQPIPSGFLLSPNGYHLMPVIEFDIAVSVNEELEVSAGAGAALTVVGIGAKGKSKTSETTISRIHFSIPVDIPVLPNSDKQ
jgi:hypothetical protein